MNITQSIQEAITVEKVILFEAKNGHIIHIKPEDAQDLVAIHDSMNQENQIKMRSLLEHSEEKFNKILLFCQRQLNGGK
jgi:hypothetical protein